MIAKFYQRLKLLSVSQEDVGDFPFLFHFPDVSANVRGARLARLDLLASSGNVYYSRALPSAALCHLSAPLSLAVTL
jgi:hypothetical protein